VGFANYRRLLAEPQFYWSLLMTGCYALCSIPFGISVAFLLALLLNNNLPGKNIFRAGYFLPVVVDGLAVSFVWILLYAGSGVLPTLLAAVGISSFTNTGFLGDPWTAMPSVVFAMTLKGAGFGMILFLVSIQRIDPSLYEAASLEGASWWQSHRHVTLPLVKPIVLFMVITGVIGALNAFVEIYGMTGGGPSVAVSDWVPFFGGTTQGATKVSGYFLYQKFVENLEYGYGAAIAYVLLVVTIVSTAVFSRLLGFWGRKDG
jgi:ABC-type sugar transport system permease subunit